MHVSPNRFFQCSWRINFFFFFEETGESTLTRANSPKRKNFDTRKRFGQFAKSRDPDKAVKTGKCLGWTTLPSCSISLTPTGARHIGHAFRRLHGWAILPGRFALPVLQS
jgi:hypothetical protein